MVFRLELAKLSVYGGQSSVFLYCSDGPTKTAGEPVYDKEQPRQAAPSPSVLDLFSGAGGIALGYKRAGYSLIGGLDNATHALRSFEANLGAAGMLRDLRQGDFGDVDDFLDGARPDVIVGGPSCQGFSTSGGLSRSTGRDQSDPRNRLFINYIDLVEHLEPSWVMFENVTGLLLYDRGRVALEIVRAFREIGYSLVPMILLAADFGVPQLRRRLVFVGNRTGASLPFPAATHGDPELWKGYSLPFAHLSRIGHGEAKNTESHIGFAEACSDLPAIGEASDVDELDYASGPQTAYQHLMRDGCQKVRQHFSAPLADVDRLAATTLKPGENWRNLPLSDLPPRFSRIRPYDATTVLKRLRPDLPSYTVTTKFHEATTGAFIHPDQPRTLTIREAARLQSFPDSFVFDGPRAQVRQQIGNAVPPLLAQAVAEVMLPAVVKDVFNVDIEAARDTIEIDSGLSGADILRLKAPRKGARGTDLLETA